MEKVLRKLLVSVFAFFVIPSWAENSFIGKRCMEKKVSKVLLFFFCLIFSILSYGQSGSSGSPFTSLGQARNVTVAGTYYFNIGGTSFSTYVDASGYVLIAVDRQDIAPSPAIPLPSRTALVTTSDGILSTGILSLVTTSTVDQIKFTSLIGDYNALNTNATLITRISNSQSLFTGSNDNALNDDWTGTGSNYLKVDGNSTGLGTPNQLSSIVFHCSGNGNGTHWLPSYNWLQVTNVIGNKAGDIFYLYVRPMVVVDNTVGAASSTPSLCINTALTDITHSTTGATGIGTATGLPAGVSASWSSNTITISGTPTESGTFNYSIPLTGGSGSVNATGTITVNAGTTPSFTTQPGASVCTNTNVTYTTQSGQTNYTWTIPGTLNTDYSITSGGVGTSSNTVTLKWLTAGSKTVTINYSSANGCAASSATSSTATTVNAAPVVAGVSQNGAFGNGLNLDGANDYVVLPNPISNAFTIEYWVKSSQTSPTGSQWYEGNGIVDAEYGGGTTDFGTVLLNGKLAFGVGESDLTIQSTSSINTGSWNHVAASWNGTTGAMKLYINGIEEATTTGPTGARAAVSRIVIGRLQTDINNFDGSVDELRIWNVARTQSEIQSTINSELAGTETGLVAYYNFNQGTANGTNTGISTLTDRTSNGNNGTLYNFALTGSTSNWSDGAESSGSSSSTGIICANSTVQLSNATTGGVWSTSDASIATVVNTGLVTGVAAGTVTISYTVTNASNCTTTATTTITVVTPVFLTQPSSAALSTCAGAESLNVEVDPGGSSTISSYKWYSNASSSNSGGSLLVTNTTSSSTNSYSPTASAYYYVTATNSNGCETTSAVSGLVTITPAPVISSQPSATAQSLCINTAPTALTVTAAAGSGSIKSYKWYSNTSNSTSGGTLVSTTSTAATTNSYTPSTATVGSLYYYCVITNTNDCSVTTTVSGGITVVAASVGGTASAASTSIASGGTATLSLIGHSGSIQWQQSSDGSSWSNVSGGSGATSATYTTAAITATIYYRAAVTNSNCTEAYSNTLNIGLYGITTVTSFSPESGITGSTINISGTNFSSTYSNNIVYFGATRAVVNSGTTTTLNVTVPIGASYKPITVLNTETKLIGASARPFKVTFTGAITSTMFDTKYDITHNEQQYRIGLGDFNNDGLADLAVPGNNASPAGGSTANVAVLKNQSTNGSLSFAARSNFGTTGINQNDLTVADFDGDGKLDMVSASRTTNGNMYIQINNSTGSTISFTNQITITTGRADDPPGIAVDDFDKDGKMDIVVVSGSSEIKVYRNTSTTSAVSFSLSNTLATGAFTYAISTADLNGDNYPEILTANVNGNSVSVFRNTTTVIGTPNFDTKVDFTMGGSPRWVAVGDMDGDNKVDMVTSNYNSTASVLLNQISSSTGAFSSASFATKVDLTAPPECNGVAINDLDGDGKMDIALVRTGGTGRGISIIKNNSTAGSLSFGSKLDFAGNTGFTQFNVHIADFDGDGRSDVITGGWGGVSIYRYGCTSPTISTQPSTSAQNLCLNGTTTALSISATAGVGTISGYQWYSNANSSNSGGTPISGATSNSYTPLATAAGSLYYYCVVTNSSGCTKTSNVSGLVTVSAASISGSITGAGTVTSGTNSTTLTLSGYTGSIQWQSSPDNSTFSNIVGQTAATYTATNLTTSTFYKAVVTNGSCASATSAVVTITVAAPSTAFGITGSTTANTMSNNVATVVDPAITVNANGTISGFTVTITNDYTDGDILGYTGTLPYGVNVAAFDVTSRSLYFTGTASAADWQTLLRTVTLTSTSNCYPTSRKVSFLPSNKFYNYFNGHYYEYISTPLSWTAAKAAAASRSFYGRKGYLVTISSESENNYIWKLIAHNSWIGLSSVHTEINSALGYNRFGSTTYGQFYWVTGPEKGTAVSTGLGGSLTPVSGVYNNWTSGEPNNYKSWGENSGHMFSTSGKWNDFRAEGANNGREPIPYIVEYGGSQGDDTSFAASFTRDIIISGSPAGTISGAATVCNGTNSTTLTFSGTGTVQRWEYSTDNFVTAGTTVVSTASTLTATNLSSSRYYRAVVNTSGCTNLASSSALITVATSTAGSITALSGDVCGGGNAALTLNGNIGDIQKWQVSTSADFTTGVTDISNTTNDLSYPLSSNGTYYFRAAVLNSACVGGTPVYTEGYPVTVTTGTPPVGGTVNSVDYCGGSNSGTLTLSGATGTSYQWEVSTDGGVVYTNAGNTSTTLSYTGITTTTKYRVLVTSGSCGTTTSSVGTVAVNTAYVDNTISLSSSAGTNAQTIFYNQPISNIRYVTTGATGASFSGLPSGVTGAWANDVITISGTPLNYGSSSYTITLTGGCAASTVTATGTIVVNTRVSTAAVLSGTATICNGTSTNLSVAITDGTGPYTVVYSNGTSNITVTNYTSGANIPVSPTATTTYSLVSVSNAYGFAGTGNSGTATITVTPVSVAGTISGAGGTCFGTAKTLTLSGNTGTIQWQVSTTSSSSGFSDISGATASTYTVSDATAVGTYYYQAVVTNGVCNAATTATVVTVNVIAYPVVSAITGSDNLCLNASTILSNTTAGGVWSTTTPSIATINSTSGLVTGIASGSATLNYTVTNSIAGESNYGSVLLNGTNQSLSLNPGIGTIGTGAFTFECWFKLNSTPSNRSSILGTGTGNYLSINVNSLTEIETDAYGINRLGFTVPTMSVGTWYHLAVVRNSSGVETIFLNGVRSTTGTVTDSKNYNGPSNTIGHWQAGTYFPGNLASIRAVVGSSLYDPTQSTITVPSFPLSSVTNTKLLLLAQSSSTLLTDGSGIQTVTNNNTSTWSSSSPSGLSACPTTVTKTVTINPLPVVAPITGNTSICSSATSQLTSTTTGGVWSSATPSVATVDNTGLVTRVAVGTSIISYTVTNASNCSTTASTTVTVNALPTPTFTSQAGSIVCLSTDVTYTTESGQSSYVWTVPGTLGTDYSITSGGIGSTSNTVTLKWLTSGSKTVTINYNNASGCSAASATSSTATTVRPSFTTGAVSTTGETICYGGTPVSTIGNTTASSGGDATITYSWRSSADGYTAAISGATSATYLPPAGLTTTTSYRRYSTDGTCNTTPTVSSGTWTVTVSQIPTTANAGPDQNVSSSGGTISATLAGNTPSVGTGLWTIESGTGGTITTPTSPTSTISGTAGVTYVLRWTISNSPCNTSSDEITITSTYIWTGSGGDDLWDNGNNWSAGSKPNAGSEILISSGNPKLNIDYSVGGSLTLSGTGTLTVNAGKTLSIPSGGTADFGGKLVTFKSDATGTGQLGAVAGTLSGATNVVVERHIPAGKRAFRFFSSSVTTTGSIRDNWMEGATPAVGNLYPYRTQSVYNPNLGYGTLITGTGGATNGFDASETNNASLFTFNNSTGAWAEVASTAGTITAGNAYRMLVRGDRSYNIMANTPPTPTATILRTRGTIVTGTRTSGTHLPALNQSTGGWSLVGNPYQSVVDMAGSDVVKTNLTDYYYIWDPRMGTRGAYVAYNYVMNTSANVSSAVNRYAQPGQAFFVQASAAGSAIQFTEAAKGAATNQSATFGKNDGKGGTTGNEGYKIEVTQQRNEVMQTGGFASLSMLLYETDSLTTGGTPADATRVLFAATYSNNVDLKDGRKFTNLDETMAVKQNNTLLSMELRALPDTGTLLPLNITQYRATKYTLRVFWDKMLTDSTRRAYLKDKFTAMEYMIDRGGNYIDLAYTITSDAKSSAADRFEVVFKNSANVVTAVTNYSNGDYVRTYPNPVLSLMKVEYKLGMQRELTLKVYDMSGRVVLEQKKVKSGDQVNMSRLLRGIYQYQLLDKTGKLLMADKLLKD